jgi:TolA-binding protein
MGKQWVRQQMKKHELQDAVDKAIRWISENRQTAGIAAASAAGVMLLAGLFLYSHRAKNNAAWDLLSLANGYAYAGQAETAVKKIDELESQYQSTPAAAYGLLFAGDLLLHRSSFPDSMKYYKQLLDRGPPQHLQPFALCGMTVAQEALGQYNDAIQAGERFLNAYPDHFLAPQVHSALARCQVSSGQTDAAKATLQKIALQYPDTSWAGWAQNKLKAMSGGA